MMRSVKSDIHEPVELQRENVRNTAGKAAVDILAGEDCDQVSGGTGPLGSFSNPIPVNGPAGQVIYIGKLRNHDGTALFFHRMQSALSPVSKHAVDIYEFISMDNTQGGELCFDLYHPRRSNLAPPGFELAPYPPALGKDLPLAYGVNEYVDDFPYGIPKALIRVFGESPGATFANYAQRCLDSHSFPRVGCSTDVPDEADLENATRWNTTTQERRDTAAIRLYNKVLKGERTHYALYLRAFEDEEGVMFPEHRAHEQLLAYCLGAETPLIALSSAATKQHGAARLNSENDWKAVFEKLAANALVIFMQMPPIRRGSKDFVYHDENSRTRNQWFAWELEHLLSSDLLGRVVQLQPEVDKRNTNKLSLSPYRAEMITIDMNKYRFNLANIHRVVTYFRVCGDHLPAPTKKDVQNWRMRLDGKMIREISLPFDYEVSEDVTVLTTHILPDEELHQHLHKCLRRDKKLVEAGKLRRLDTGTRSSTDKRRHTSVNSRSEEERIHSVHIIEEYVELYMMPKLAGLTDSDREAEDEISEGRVRVNGRVETQKNRKIFGFEIIDFKDKKCCLVASGMIEGAHRASERASIPSMMKKLKNKLFKRS